MLLTAPVAESVLVQDTDKRRRLQQVSDNEGGGGGSGLDAGCFPDFYDISDWQAWLDGTYQGNP